MKMTETPSHLFSRPHLLVGFCLVTRLPPQHQESDQETMFECCDDQGLTGRVFQLRVGSGLGIGKNYRVGSGLGLGSGIGNIY